MGEQLLLDRLREDGPTGADRQQRRQVVAVRLAVERVGERAGHGVTHQAERGAPLLLGDPPGVLGVEAAPGVQRELSADEQRDEHVPLRGAVHQRAPG